LKRLNSKSISLDEIKKRDGLWRKVAGLDADMKAMMTSKAAQRLFTLSLPKTHLDDKYIFIL